MTDRMHMRCDEAQKQMAARVEAKETRTTLAPDPMAGSAADWSDLTEHLAQCAACSAYWLNLLGQRNMLVRPGIDESTDNVATPFRPGVEAGSTDKQTVGAAARPSLRGFLLICAVLAGLIMVTLQLIGRPPRSSADGRIGPQAGDVRLPDSTTSRSGAGAHHIIAIEVADLQTVRDRLADLESESGRIVDTATAVLDDDRQIARYAIEVERDEAEELTKRIEAMGRVLWVRGAGSPASDASMAREDERVLIEITVIE